MHDEESGPSLVGRSPRLTRPAAWTGHALRLLEELGPEWDTRGAGLGLMLVRQRSPWLLDLIMCERTRSGDAGKLRVAVIDLLDGHHVITLSPGTECYLQPIDDRSQRRRIVRHVLGAGLYTFERFARTPRQWGCQRIDRLETAHFKAEPRAWRRAMELTQARVWQLVLDPEAGDPPARHIGQEVDELLADDDHTDIHAELRADARRLVEIARLDPEGRLAALRQRAAAKLAAIGLDESQRKRVRAPKHEPDYLPPVSWAELTEAIAAALDALTDDTGFTLRELVPDGRIARLLRTNDGFSVEFDGAHQAGTQAAAVASQAVSLLRQGGIDRPERLGRDRDGPSLPLQTYVVLAHPSYHGELNWIND